jgi:hypothetical protein
MRSILFFKSEYIYKQMAGLKEKAENFALKASVVKCSVHSLKVKM